MSGRYKGEGVEDGTAVVIFASLHSKEADVGSSVSVIMDSQLLVNKAFKM